MNERKKDDITGDFPIRRDLMIMIGSTTLSFSTIYIRGILNSPPNPIADFTWSIFSFSFLVNSLFICIGLPIFHFIYTFPAYFVRDWIGRALRLLIKAVLISFPFFLLNGKIAYVAIDNHQKILVLNDGDTVACEAATTESTNGRLISHVFVVDGARYYTFSHFRSELPAADFSP